MNLAIKPEIKYRITKQWIFFDLDGTLTDPMIGITSAVKYALGKYGIGVEDLWKLTPFIGPPLKDSFMNFYDFSEEKAEEAIFYYREYYGPKGLYENEPYEGIGDMLSRLKEAGCYLAVATSKPTVFAKRILEHFDLAKYFSEIVGSEMNGHRTEKAEVIKEVMERTHAQPSEILMVGDRLHDIHGAKKCGIDSVGVLYGYGSREELEEAGASYVVETVSDLESLILGFYPEK